MKRKADQRSPSIDPAPAVDEQAVRAQLRRILESPEFHATPRQREFLCFVVDETLAGHADTIKGFTIATQVFGRSDDFDQAIDPIVSIQANKLRRALERYYLVAGGEDAIRIDIPKGTYVPTFDAQAGTGSGPATDGGESLREDRRAGEPAGAWPTVSCAPFENLTGDPESNHIALGMATELAMELARFQDLRVLLEPPGQPAAGSPGPGARFTISGTVQQDGERLRVAVRLVDNTTGIQLWSDVHRSPLEAASLVAFQEEVARAVAGTLSCEDGVIARTLSTESKRKPPGRMQTYDAILRYYEYDQTYSSESFARALPALERAVAVEPDCCQVWSMLGRLYGNIHSLDIPGFDDPLEKAVRYAEKAVQLNPGDQRARAILSYVRLLADELPAAREEADRALALNPSSLLFLDVIGYLLTLQGDWERGPRMIRKAMVSNPYYKPIVHYALWLDLVRQEDDEAAYRQALKLRRPAIFWDSLARAATLGLLGRGSEGGQAADELLRLRPDFPERGRCLIGRFIKFDEIAERVVTGLRASGLDID